jgi:hypothetical protein
VLGGLPGVVVVWQFVVPFAVAVPPIPYTVALLLQFVVELPFVPGMYCVNCLSLVCVSTTSI